MDNNKNELVEYILGRYEEYLQTKEAKEHLRTMEKEKAEVKDLMTKLETMNKESDEFTELVLYGLLPNAKSKFAKRISLFPAFMNIKKFFKEYNYTESEWKIIAKKVYKFAKEFQADNSKLPELIREFTADKYSRRIQCGTITPIIFCLNDSYPLLNYRTIKTYYWIYRFFGHKATLSSSLQDYPASIKLLTKFADDLGLEILFKQDYLDLFCYWFDSKLRKETAQKIKKEKIIQAATEEIDIKTKEVDFRSFFDEINLEKVTSFHTHSLGNPDTIKINSIIPKVADAEWVLPHFQRYFDWEKADVKELWESIFHDYYIGSFLLWETENKSKLGTQVLKGVKKDISDARINAIILDGQQRMTSLYYAIKAPEFPLKGDKEPLYFYANFHSLLTRNSNNGVIVYHPRKISPEESYKKMLFPLFEFENYNKWINGFEEFLIAKTEDYKHAKDVRNIINDKLWQIWQGFEIPYVMLPKSMGLAEVTDIFENLNTRGKILSVFDLLIARLYNYDIELKKLWDNTQTKYPNIKRYYKEGKIEKIPIYILQAMSLLYEKGSSAKRSDVLDIYSNVYEGTERSFEKDWDDIATFMDKAIEKLENMRDGFGVRKERDLPFAPMIPVLTALLRVIPDEENMSDCYTKLRKWYWSAVFTNAYSSAADSQMTMDFRDMKGWFKDSASMPRIVEKMGKELQILGFRMIQSTSNAQYRGVLSLIALEGAKDFETGQALENERENDKDHLFPKSKTKGFGNHRNINSVLNITWLSKKTNERKGTKKPDAYIQEFIGQKYSGDEERFFEITKTHLISRKAFDYLVQNDMESFLKEREQLILDKIRGILGIDVPAKSETLISPDKPFSNRLAFVNTLKSCHEYIYWMEKYFTKKGLEFLKDALEEADVLEIRIVMPLEQVNEEFRKQFKDFRDEAKAGGVDVGLKVIIDLKWKSSIHDRFIISKYDAFNIPSPDVAARGQLSEINKSNNREKLMQEFTKAWDMGKDIIHDWNEIKDKI